MRYRVVQCAIKELEILCIMVREYQICYTIYDDKCRRHLGSGKTPSMLCANFDAMLLQSKLSRMVAGWADWFEVSS